MDTELKTVIKEVAEQAAQATLTASLIRLGIDPEDPIEAQKDMAALREFRDLLSDPEWQKDLSHIRKWRLTMENVERKGVASGVMLIVMATGSVIFYGVKAKFFPG